ncbi:MAG: SDR family NAD(P)-dependent oxidoreductase [Pseudomonadota bacterium]
MADSSFDLTGKVALVTGGNSGIGLGMADALARAGAGVAIWGTSSDKNQKAGAQLEAHGGRVLAQRIDVSLESAVKEGFAAAVRKMGRIDAVFANAGVMGAAPSFIDLTTQEWRRVLGVNLDGAFFTLREASRHMVERGGGGSLVGTSSLAALCGLARAQHYGATKGAMIAMIRACAVELARHGIRANAILPGWVDTGMTSAFLDSDPFQKRVLPRVPVRRWGAPADFGGVAVYLASDASRYHTGDTFVIDGGYSIF